MNPSRRVSSWRSALRPSVAPPRDAALAGVPPRDLPVRPALLTCARCGRVLAEHGGEPPDCAGFLRPALRPGLAYVDELVTGDAFRFLALTPSAAVRTVSGAVGDLDPFVGLLQVESHAAGAGRTVHVVERNTVVELVGTGVRAA